MTLWLPGIARQSWGTDGGSWTGGPPKGVLHSTETSTFPGYQSGQTCPHFTIKVDRPGALVIRQHVPLDRAARALMNLSGGVQTNRDHAIQIELVGTCNPSWKGKAGYYFWPDADLTTLAALGSFMRRLESACGITRQAVTPWLPYPASYANSHGQRLTLSQWDNYSGWVGHQHVPENVHGDPGNIDVAKLFIGGTPASLPPASSLPNAYVKPPVKPAATVKPPAFPLPRGHVFGPRTGPTWQHSGYAGSRDREGLRTWQKQMRSRGWTIGVDGLYGTETATVARQFQKEKRLTVDSLIGPTTWAAAWTAPK